MKPRVFYLLDEEGDEIYSEIRIFYSTHYVCIHGSFGAGYTVESYGKCGYREVINNHLEEWEELKQPRVRRM